MNWNQMQRDIQKEVERIGFTYLADKPISTHPDDWYLRIVLGLKEDGSYATWLYNDTMKGLFHGHYDLSQEQANSDFLARN